MLDAELKNKDQVGCIFLKIEGDQCAMCYEMRTSMDTCSPHTVQTVLQFSNKSTAEVFLRQYLGLNVISWGTVV